MAVEWRKAPDEAMNQAGLFVANMPTPDWSNAPAWARFWAADADGEAYWYRNKPAISEGSTVWDIVSIGDSEHDRNVIIPVGVDWRTLIYERPESIPLPQPESEPERSCTIREDMEAVLWFVEERALPVQATEAYRAAERVRAWFKRLMADLNGDGTATR